MYRGHPDRQATGARREVATPAEVTLQRLWSAVLGVAPDAVGADDTFVDVGGDSVSAMRLVAAARREGFDMSRRGCVFARAGLSVLAASMRDTRQTVESRSQSYTHGDTIQPFSLLTGAVDEAAVRAEVMAKCGETDPGIVEDVYPCTPLQESMLVASSREPGAFVSMRLYRIPDHVPSDQLRSAWAAVVQRNRHLTHAAR